MMKITTLVVFVCCAASYVAAIDTVAEAGKTQTTTSNDILPLKTIAEVGTVVPKNDAEQKKNWDNSHSLFQGKQEERGNLDVLHEALLKRKDTITQFVHEKVKAALGAKEEEEKKKEQNAASSTSSIAVPEGAFEKAFADGLGDVVVVVEEEGKNKDGQDVRVEVATSLPDPKLAAHINMAKELEKEREEEAQKSSHSTDASTSPEDILHAEEDNNADEDDEDLLESEKLLQSPEVAARVGGVLGHLFNELAKKEQELQHSPNLISKNQASGENVPTSSPLPPALSQMQQWAKLQMQEMGGLLALRDDLRRRRDAMIHAQGGNADGLDDWRRHWNGFGPEPFHARDDRRSWGRRGGHGRRGRGHRRGGRGHHRGRHHRREHNELAELVQHIMMDEEMPALGNFAHVTKLPNGQIAVQVSSVPHPGRD